MRCECSRCTNMFDHWQVMLCPGCDEYFCQGCWDEHQGERCHK